MATHDNNPKAETQGEHLSFAEVVRDTIKMGAVGGFREAAKSFFLPVRLGWRLSLLLVRRLRPITEPIMAAALMFAVLMLLGLAAEALLSPYGL